MQQTERLVDAYLEERSTKLKNYLTGPSWLDFWEAPSSVDRETSQFLNDLRIPKFTRGPVLILHNLGGDIVDPTVVNRVFTSESA